MKRYLGFRSSNATLEEDRRYVCENPTESTQFGDSEIYQIGKRTSSTPLCRTNEKPPINAQTNKQSNKFKIQQLGEHQKKEIAKDK